MSIFIIATVVFFIGFHSIDNAWNMSSTCWDSDLLNNQYTRTELYKMGLAQVFFSFVLFFISVFISNLRVKKFLNIRYNNN